MQQSHIELKKKRILVISAAEGQQDNVKRVFEKCGFFYDSESWLNIKDLPKKVLVNVDILLFNDYKDYVIEEEQIESAMQRFGKNVSYFYFGDKRLKSEDYRKKYEIELDFCNSASRLEAGLLSLLKIR